MPVRRLTSEDALAFRRLSAFAFGGRFDPASVEPFQDGTVPLGVDSEDLPHGLPGVLAAGLSVREDRVVLGGREVRCGGIASLAVHPAHRGHGLFGDLLRAAIAQCRAGGQGLSMLHPSNPGIYRRAGWQVFTTIPRVIVPLADLSTLPRQDGLHLAPVTDATFAAVRALYREAIQHENAMLVREGPLFSPREPGGAFEAVLVVDDDGTPRGYLSYDRVQADSGAPGLDVHEVIAAGPAERIALLRSLGSWSTVSPSARIRLLTDDPLLDLIPHGSIENAPGQTSQVMLRVTDVPVALAERGAPEGLEGRLRLEVEDPFAPEVAGTWDVTISGGAVRAENITQDANAPSGSRDGDGADRRGPDTGGAQAIPAARLDVRALALLLAGGRGVRDVRRLGLRLDSDPAADALLDALVAGPRPSVLDFF